MTIESKKSKLSVYDVIAIISALGIISWIITDFFGGMIIWIISFGIIIIPILLLYIFSVVETIISLIRKGKVTSKIKLFAHGTVLLSILAFNLYHSEIFKSEKIITASLKDDLSFFRLILRKDGNVENHVYGMLGYSKIFYGKYKINKDLIIFIEKPYDNNFIPDTLLIDKKKNALFMKKDTNGDFLIEKKWLNYFRIEEIKE